jgi:hypothetical protein
VETVKIIKRKKPVLVKNEYGKPKIKREGEAYYEVNYWDGFYWVQIDKEFATRIEAEQEASKHRRVNSGC